MSSYNNKLNERRGRTSSTSFTALSSSSHNEHFVPHGMPLSAAMTLPTCTAPTFNSVGAQSPLDNHLLAYYVATSGVRASTSTTNQNDQKSSTLTSKTYSCQNKVGKRQRDSCNSKRKRKSKKKSRKKSWREDSYAYRSTSSSGRYSSLSSSSYSGDSTRSNSCFSSNSDESSASRDKRMHYPRFDGISSNINRKEPFFRFECIDGSSDAALNLPLNDSIPLLMERGLPVLAPNRRIVAFDQFIIDKVVGKGISALVVAAHRLSDSKALQENTVLSPSSKITQAYISPGCSIFGENVALKIFRANHSYDEACEDEAEMVSRVINRTKTPYVLPFLAKIRHPSHSALVYPLCGKSVYDILEMNHFSGFSFYEVRSILLQLLKCTQAIHEAGIVHTDIKVENILFEYPEIMKVKAGGPQREKLEMQLKEKKVDSGSKKGSSSYNSASELRLSRSRSVLNKCPTLLNISVPVSSSIKVIDLGNAVSVEKFTKINKVTGKPCSFKCIQTRHYRAPEVILNSGWDESADIWSIGCIAVELITGECIFMTHNDEEQLALMEKIIGPIPFLPFKEGHTLYEYAHTQKTDCPFLNLRKSKKVSESYVAAQLSLEQLIKQGLGYGMHLEAALMFDLVRKLLTYDPSLRISAKDACNHSLFRGTNY